MLPHKLQQFFSRFVNSQMFCFQVDILNITIKRGVKKTSSERQSNSTIPVAYNSSNGCHNLCAVWTRECKNPTNSRPWLPTVNQICQRETTFSIPSSEFRQRKNTLKNTKTVNRHLLSPSVLWATAHRNGTFVIQTLRSLHHKQH